MFEGSLVISESAAIDHIYIHNGITSTVLGSFPTPQTTVQGLATDSSGNLISIDGATNHIFVHQGLTSTLTGSFTAPTTNPVGAGFWKSAVVVTTQYIFQFSDSFITYSLPITITA